MIKAQTTREKISRAAIRLFVKNGIAETPMRDIAKAVDVSEAALYRHFSGKDAMVWDLFKYHYDLFAAYLEKSLLQKNAKGKVTEMVKSCCELFDQDRDVFFFLLMTQHMQKFYPDNYQPKLPRLIYTIIQTAIENKELPPQDAEISTAMVMGIVMQTASSLLHRGNESLTHYRDHLGKVCWQVLKIGQ